MNRRKMNSSTTIILHVINIVCRKLTLDTFSTIYLKGVPIVCVHVVDLDIADDDNNNGDVHPIDRKSVV